MANDSCSTCGAPHEAGYAQCKYCKTPLVQNSNAQAIPCPNPACATLNEWGAQKCVKCHAWIVVQCVFCSAISPHHVPACLSCHEAFAGAPERLRQRKEAQASAQRMNMLGTVAPIAAGLVGAAGIAMFARSEHHHQESWSANNEEGWASRDNGGGGGLMEDLTGGSSNNDSGGGGGLMDDLGGGSSNDDDGGGSSDDY